MPTKGLARKQDESGPGKRMLLLDQEKCKPGMAAHDFLKRISKCPSGQECITVGGPPAFPISIMEDSCLACLNRAKRCPGEALRIINLPSNLTTNVTHQYGLNSFKLHGLPTPRAGNVLGILGCNGIGKSTALNTLCGRLKPNLGRLKEPPGWADIMAYYRGSDLQTYFTRFLEEELTVVHKPQLDGAMAKGAVGKKVGDLLRDRDERGVLEEMGRRLELDHLLEREVHTLSGGELQRLAIATVVMRKADVYLFDEPSSFLDIRQRMTAVDIIRSLVFDDAAEASGEANPSKYVVVIEHDLAVLDAVSDYVCCLYGEAGAWGASTKIATVRNGINNFLAGYIPAENMRFRAEALHFQVSTGEGSDAVLAADGGGGTPTVGTVQYPGATKTLVSTDGDSRFTLHVEPGDFKGAEMIGMLGENGCGKTTFMDLLAGTFERGGEEGKDEGDEHSLKGLGVAYKRQHYAPRFRKFAGTVGDLFERAVQGVVADRFYRLLVLRPLQLEALERLDVRTLSGGELQRVAIAVCLGTPASVYLFDEPSAGLDCEQRVVVSKVIRRWVVDHMRKTAFVIEHDFVMAAALSDRTIVFSGRPGVECTASAPRPMADGFNAFLESLDVTFRRDPANYRPRINKRGSAKDREQKAAGAYFIFDADEDPAEAAERKAAEKEGGGGKKKK